MALKAVRCQIQTPNGEDNSRDSLFTNTHKMGTSNKKPIDVYCLLNYNLRNGKSVCISVFNGDDK